MTNEWDDVEILEPSAMRSIIDAWPTDNEEDLQLAALGWFLEFRKDNVFRPVDSGKGHWSRPVPYPQIWFAHKGRMIEWAWLEQGGLDLSEMHLKLLGRHRIRIEMSEPRVAPTIPASVGSDQKET
jgi:hypothetical protein